MSDAANLPATVDAGQISLRDTNGLIGFVDSKKELEPAAIMAFIAEQKLMPPELLYVLHGEILEVITQLRANAVAAVGKKTALIALLEEASREAIANFMTENAGRLEKVLFLSSEAMLNIQLLGQIALKKDLGGVPNEDIERGYIGISDLSASGARLLAEVTIRATAALNEQGGAKCTANPVHHSGRAQIGYIDTRGPNPAIDFEKMLKEWLSTNFPTLEFSTYNKSDHLEIHFSGKKKK